MDSSESIRNEIREQQGTPTIHSVERIQDFELDTRSRITVFNISTEITVEMFHLIIKNHINLKKNDWRRITLTHVCKKWRDIAINAQELWTNIQTWRLVCPEQTAEYLKRSGASKLAVYHHGQMINNTTLQSLNLILVHLHRIRDLKIVALQDFPDELRNGLLQNPALVLQKFSLETSSRGISNFGTLFTGQAPRLTDFSLCVNSPTWVNESIMQNLKRVRIGSSSSPVRLRDVYFLLSQSSIYEKFWITPLLNAGPPYDLCPYLSPIRLPHLQDLVISNAAYKQLTQLYQKIILPKDISYDISCTDYPIDIHPEANPKSIFPCISSERPAKSIIIAMSPNSISLTADPDYRVDLFSDNILQRRRLSYSWTGPNVSTVDNFGVVCSIIKGGFWCDATDLTLDIAARAPDAHDLYMSERLSEGEWITLLNMFPKLQSLTVGHVRNSDTAAIVKTESHYGLLMALGSGLRDSQHHGIEHEHRDVICPNLSELHLSGFDSANRDTVILLMEALDYRDGCGSCVYSLRITEPSVKPKWNFPNLEVLKRSGVAHSIEIAGENIEDLDMDDPMHLYVPRDDEADDIRDWRSRGGHWWI